MDEGESLKEALIREAKEELGIIINYSDISFGTLIHKRSKHGHVYYNVYFIVEQYEGIPSIKEPNKCSGLEWFDINLSP